MKLEFVEIEGFRGFRRNTRFELPLGFAVISGRNGAGKSTILDAVDFAMTGSINKFSVENARGGGLDQHIWWLGEGRAEKYYVRIGFVDDTGKRYSITRRRDISKVEGLNEVLSHLHEPVGGDLSAEGVMETTLIRDELIAASSLDLPGHARFNVVKAAIGSIAGKDRTERASRILGEAKEALDDEQSRVSQLQLQLSSLLSQLTEARTAANQAPDLADALRLLEQALPNSSVGTSAEGVRSLIADRKTFLARFNQARTSAAKHATDEEHIAGESFNRELDEAAARHEQASEMVKACLEKLQLAEALATAERGIDEQETHFAILIAHGEAIGLLEGHCPLCDAIRTDQEFAASISAIRARLAGQAERIANAENAVQRAQSDLSSARATESEAQRRLTELNGRLADVLGTEAFLREEYRGSGFGDVLLEDLIEAERRAAAEQQSIIDLERAVLILETSTAADRVSSLELQIAALRRSIDTAAARVSRAETAVETARQIDSAAKSVANEILVEQFETVMPLLKELYRRLRPHTDWTEIDSEFGGRVRGSLNFMVGEGRNPQFLFSSGQRRAAGLAFLLAVHLSRPWCHWRSLLLDDPVQHVDDYRALNLVEVLAAIRRSGRQVLVAVEDAALADLLCRRLRSVIGETGRRFDLTHSASGAAEIATTFDIPPLPGETLRLSVA
jgi:chromosome segregation protein